MALEFFPMSRGDVRYLLVLVAFTATAFMPWTRAIQIAGLSLFGWLMAALMILSPAIALARLWRARRGDTAERS